MRSKFIKTSVFCLLALLSTNTADAGYSIRNGKIVDVTYLPSYLPEEHYNLGVSAYEARDMQEAHRQFSIVVTHFPKADCYANALFYKGAAFFEMKEYDLANEAFSEYLKLQNAPELFQEAIAFKYEIAVRFCNGAKRRIMCTRKLPKWFSGESLALEIFDEVIAAMPSHELAAESLYAKGCELWRQHDYKGAVEAYQTLIRRFGRHEKAPECYLLINRVFLAQVYFEFQNPDILGFSEINYKRFERDFPKDERLIEAKADVMAIKEIYANGLYETGRFYEKLCKYRAACIYYQNAILSFPDTNVAASSRQRLFFLNPELAASIPNDLGSKEPTLEELEANEQEEGVDLNLEGMDLEGINLEPIQDVE